MNIIREPLVIINFVLAVLALLVAFGVPISADQQQAVIDALTKGLMLVGLFAAGTYVARSKVTPVAAPRLPENTVVTVTHDDPMLDDHEVTVQ